MKSGKLFCSFWVVFALLMVLLTEAGAAEPTQKTKSAILKIGSAMPMSGPAGPWGIVEQGIATIYADLLNKDGGITVGDTNYKIEFIPLDDKNTPDGMKAAAERLVHTEKVNAVVGGWLPPAAPIFGRLCTAANIPVIHNVREIPGGGDVVSPKYPVMFDLGWPQIIVLKMYIPKLKSAALPNLKTFAMLTKDDTLGRGIAEVIKDMQPQWQKEYGLKLAYDAMFPMTAQDMTPWMSKIAALPQKVDLIFAASALPPTFAMIAKQSYEMGLKVPVLSTGPLIDVGEFIKLVGYDAAQYCYTSGCAPWDFPNTSPKYKDMANRVRVAWKEKHGTDLTFGDGFTWVANQLAAYVSAVKLANSVKTEDVVRTLATKPIEHFYGTSVASGEKTYGIKRMLTFDGTISKIVGGEQKPIVSFGEPVP